MLPLLNKNLWFISLVYSSAVIVRMYATTFFRPGGTWFDWLSDISLSPPVDLDPSRLVLWHFDTHAYCTSSRVVSENLEPPKLNRLWIGVMKRIKLIYAVSISSLFIHWINFLKRTNIVTLCYFVHLCVDRKTYSNLCVDRKTYSENQETQTID
jgi:hypothetical protein